MPGDPLDSQVIRIVRWLLSQTGRVPLRNSPRPGAEPADHPLSLGPVENYLENFGATLEQRQGSGILVVADSAVRNVIVDDLALVPIRRGCTPRGASRLMIAGLLWAFPGLTSLDELQGDLGVSKTSARRVSALRAGLSETVCRFCVVGARCRRGGLRAPHPAGHGAVVVERCRGSARSLRSQRRWRARGTRRPCACRVARAPRRSSDWSHCGDGAGSP